MKSAKKQKKGHISEEDMSNLLHRYPAQKVLALLQEVSQSAESKMDWNALVQKTATGITNAREYQMLWRHIAYCEELLEKVDDAAQPLDDDSDLEYELEAYPALSAEASAEAAACVKVLIGSGLPGDSKVPNSATVEAPLTINIPTNGQSSKSFLENSLPASMQGTNITVPVSVQKQPVAQGSVQKQLVPSGVTGEGLDANGLASTSLPSRRKRKPWSEEEDLELIAAVKKCGEGNWANILKGDFKGDRTASQLSQRWTIIRKRKSTVSIGAQSTAPLSEAQLAARRAIDMAFKDKPATAGNGAATTSNAGKSNPSNDDIAVVPQPQQSHSTPPGVNPISSKPGTSASLPNPQAPPKKAPLKPLLTDSSIRKVAVAAGARIASPSTAASLYKVAQANNAVHIMPKGVSNLIKSSVTSTTTTSSPPPPTHVVPNRTMPFGSQPVRPNLARPTTTPGLISHATGSQPMRSTFARPTVLPPPSKPSTSSALPNNSSAPLSQASQRVTTTAVGSTASHPNEVKVKKEEKASEVMKAPPPPHPMTRPVPTQNIGARQNPSPASSNAGSLASSQAAARVKEKSLCVVNAEKEKAAIGNSMVSAVVNAAENKCVDDLKNKNESSAQGRCGEVLSERREGIASEKQSLPSSKVVGGTKLEVRSDTIAGAEKSEQKKLQ